MANKDPVLDPNNWVQTPEGFGLKPELLARHPEFAGKLVELQRELGANNANMEFNDGRLQLFVNAQSPKNLAQELGKIEQQGGLQQYAPAHAPYDYAHDPRIGGSHQSHQPHAGPTHHPEMAGSGFQMPPPAMGGQHHGTNFGNHQFNDPRIGGSQYMHTETHPHGAPGMPPGRIDQTNVERAYKMELTPGQAEQMTASLAEKGLKAQYGKGPTGEGELFVKEPMATYRNPAADRQFLQETREIVHEAHAKLGVPHAAATPPAQEGLLARLETGVENGVNSLGNGLHSAVNSIESVVNKLDVQLAGIDLSSLRGRMEKVAENILPSSAATPGKTQQQDTSRMV